MASLVLGAALGVVGNIFAPGIGGLIGYAVGSAIGSSLDQPNVEGPRLTDLRPQRSSYGTMISWPFGLMRVAGAVVWQTDFVEHKHKSGGKGGGPTTTSYTYTVSFAVQVCKGPIIELRRIWADGRLIYDVASTVENKYNFVLYKGTETQGADPTMEAALGAGNVPGYRGTVVVVWPDLELTDFGNHIPNLEFEVVTHGEGDVPWRYASYVREQSPPNNSVGVEATEGGILVATISACSAGYGQWYTVKKYDLHDNEIETVTDQLAPMVDPTSTGNDSVWCVHNSARYAWGVQASSYDTSEPSQSAWYLDGVKVTSPVAQAYGTGTFWSIGQDLAAVTWSKTNSALYTIGAIGSGPVPTGGYFVAKYPITSDIPSGSPSASYNSWGVGSQPTSISAGEDGFIYVITTDDLGGGSSATSLWKFDQALTLVHKWDNDVVEAIPTHRLKQRVNIGFAVTSDHKILYGSRSNAVVVEQINGDNTITYLGEIPSDTYDTGLPMRAISDGLISVGHGICSIVPPAAAVTLSQIVGAISDECGLAGQYDVSELTDAVHGYIITGQTTGRSCIEPLRAAYFFDAVESDGVVKFVKRGKASMLTIPSEDLAARHPDGQEPPKLTRARLPEEELPRTVTVKYMNVGADYQVNSQYDERQVTSSQLNGTLDLPIAMADEQAKSIASVQTFTPWIERDRGSFIVPRKYGQLEPTDVVTVEGQFLRLVNEDEAPDGTIRFDWVAADVASFTQSAVANPAAGFIAPDVTSSQLSQLQLLDIPLVADTDQPGYYFAAAGSQNATWAGGSLFRSTDGGINYSSVDAVTTGNVIGSTSDTLGNYPGGNTVDRSSYVTVVIGPGGGTLSSITLTALLNGENTALIGNEIVGFMTATLTAPSTYKLSGLLRGRRGTEWAMPAHGINDLFVLLPANNEAVATSDIGVVSDFKMVTHGGLLTRARQYPLTLIGNAWKTYAPVHLGGGRNAAGDVTLKWVRRTRIGGGWKGPSNVPLSEGHEEYVVQIWEASYTVCARTITGVTAQTLVYTSAQQVTDFGAQQQTIFFTVGQVGAMGLGRQVHGTASGAGGSNANPLAPVTPYGTTPPTPTFGCTLPVPLTTTMTGPLNRYYNPNWHDGEEWVLQFTTGVADAYTRIAIAEYGGPAVVRTGTLSDSPCGQPIGPGCVQQGSTVTWNCFFPGTNPDPTNYPTLQPSTTYYVSVETVSPSSASADFSVT
jgi:hypothetical protein